MNRATLKKEKENLCTNVKATKSYFVFVVPDQLSDAVSVLWANQADVKPNLTLWLTAQIHMSSGSLLSAAYIVIW